MSVRTRADEKLDAAAERIQEAVDALGEIVVGRCWGHDEYKEDYHATIRQVYYDLIELRVRLKR